jgi:hypothetical protein
LIVGDVNVLFVKVSVPPSVATVPEVGNARLVFPVVVSASVCVLEPRVMFPLTDIVEESVPARVIELEAARVLPLVIESVPVEDDTVNPLILVAVATPMFGVVNVTELAILEVVTAPEPIFASTTAPLAIFAAVTAPSVISANWADHSVPS